MRRPLILLAVVGASFGLASPAKAAPVCVGTSNTVFVCTDPTGGTLYEDCVYTGGSTCQQVTVPGPTVDCGGDLYNRIVPPLTSEPIC
ncbi:MAG: hypothetical protein M3279_08535 [Actinomycetota bacterium]|nr:hypothetical protein [Actinomycetota bacterium]